MQNLEEGLKNNKKIIRIIERTCSHVDRRLMTHGFRVAYIVRGIMEAAGETDKRLIRDICMAALLHDVGAYKTEEIDRMEQFEAEDVWAHSIYGSLFFKYFSPLPELADAILYHHAPWRKLKNIPFTDERNRLFAQIINIADRADIFLSTSQNKQIFLDKIDGNCNIYSKEVIELFKKMPEKYLNRDRIIFSSDNDKISGNFIEKEVPSGSAEWETENTDLEEKFVWEEDFYTDMGRIPFTDEEILEYMEMLVYAIDFRSRYTVAHTLATVSIAREIGKRMELSSEDIGKLERGALLHDLGKVATPLEILEKPGVLTLDEMTVMREHVPATEEILKGGVEEEIVRIAVRHHEKIDGSGYNKGLKGDELTLLERIMAVADIAGALLGRRSYKDSYSKEKTLHIIENMWKAGLIDQTASRLFIEDFDSIYSVTEECCKPLIETYEDITREYEFLENRVKECHK